MHLKHKNFFNEKKGKYITGEYMSKSCLNYQDLFVSRNRILNTIDDHSVFFFYKILHFQHKSFKMNTIQSILSI